MRRKLRMDPTFEILRGLKWMRECELEESATAKEFEVTGKK
jgi:hypothetical protein